MKSSGLLLSVIVPAYRAADVLPHSLGAVQASTLPRDRWELIVVDDGSDDQTPEIAARYADRVLRLPDPPQGPAHARNRGGEVARGQSLVFVDADVCVHPDALSRFADVLRRNPDVAAVFGAYDTAPRSSGLISQYRNLAHHYVHARETGDAETFWSGCGAVRREVFLRVGGFDARRYPRPQIEDIELGYRMRERGYRILLHPEIQGTHLKRWTLRNMVVTDLRDRGIPWMRLRLEKGRDAPPETLNLRAIEKLWTCVSGVAGLALAVATLRTDVRWLAVAVGCVLLVVAGNARLLRWFATVHSPWFALRVVPLRLLSYLLNGFAAAGGWVLHRLAPEGGAPSRIGRTPGARPGHGRQSAVATPYEGRRESAPAECPPA